MNNLSVILCSYNEVSNIQVTLNKLLSRSEIDEIIIIDDNSNDGTLKIIKSFNNPKIKLFVRENTRGFASAFILGIKESSGKIILRFDIDMHDAIDTFLSGLKQIDFNDCIIFSRYINGGKDLRNNFRKVSSKIINILCQAILSKKILDYTSCLILFKRSILIDNMPSKTIYANFIIEFIFKLILFNKKIIELPYIQKRETELNSKSAPNMFVFAKNGFFYLITILKCFLIKIKYLIK